MLKFHLQASETPGETQFQTDDGTQRELASTTTTIQDASKIVVLFGEDKPVMSVPLQLPEHSTYTTHRAVTPVLPSHEKTSFASHRYSEWEMSPKEAQSSELFLPMSARFLAPSDHKTVFSGHQTLRACKCSEASLSDMNLVSPVFCDSISAVLKTQVATAKESETIDGESDVPLKQSLRGTDSPQHSDSDPEFFDCRQTFSDFSEAEDVKPEHEIAYHISEPPSPIPGSSPSTGHPKGSTQCASEVNQLSLWTEDKKRFPSASESLCEFAYNSEASQEYHAEGGLPIFEELPSRYPAEFYDDDDFLGRVRG